MIEEFSICYPFKLILWFPILYWLQQYVYKHKHFDMAWTHLLCYVVFSYINSSLKGGFTQLFYSVIINWTHLVSNLLNKRDDISKNVANQLVIDSFSIFPILCMSMATSFQHWLKIFTISCSTKNKVTKILLLICPVAVSAQCMRERKKMSPIRMNNPCFLNDPVSLDCSWGESGRCCDKCVVPVVRTN